MRQEIIKVYKFDELNEEVKDKVLNDHRYREVDNEWWYENDFLMEPTKEEMDRFGIVPTPGYAILTYKISSFDIYRSRYLQLEDIEIENEDAFMKLIEIPVWLRPYTYCQFSNKRNYERNTELTIEFDYPDGDDIPEIEEYLKFLSEEYFAQAERIFDEMMKEALNRLTEQYEYLMSDEAIREALIANEYEFLENGDIWR